MNIEDLVRRSADDVARRVVPPAPDVPALMERAGRTRRMRIGAAGAAAIALVAAVAIGGSVLDDTSARGPEPAGPQSSSVPVWMNRGSDTAHVGDDTVTLADEGGTPGLTETGLVYADSAGTVYSQEFDGEPVEIGENATVGVVGDPDGTLAAWIDDSGNTPALVVYDVRADDERARIDLGAVEVQSQESMVSSLSPILSVDADEVAYIADNHVWLADLATGEQPRSTRRTPDELVDLDEGVWAMRSPNASTVQFRGVDGSVVRPSLPMEADGQLSSDGQWFFGFAAEGVAVANTATGEVQQLDVGGQFAMTGAWSYGDTVMLLVPDRSAVSEGGPFDKIPGSLMSCQVSTLECETEETSPNFTTLVLPVL